ncbi:MAG: DUF393 domain-containing protein [Pseudonocardia sp.]|nr:DUF393 domain-containing protein [Pseudonocardia sp.]
MGPVLLFDGECGFCTCTVGWLRVLDGKRLIDTVPYQRPGAPESIGATAAECAASIQWRGADGTRLVGAAAVNAALAVALGSPWPLRLYHYSAATQERLYRWIATHRGRLPGITPWCVRYPKNCGQPVR